MDTTADVVTTPLPRMPRGEPWRLRGPILVALEESEPAHAALRVAHALASDHGSRLHVISVIEPLATAFSPWDGMMTMLPSEGRAVVRTAERAHALRGRVERVIDAPHGEPVHVEVGSVAPTIVRHAERIDASLIVLGLGALRPVERFMGDEVAPQVVRRAPMPVLAVPRDARVPLRRTVVGVDFSRASIRAARAAVSLTTPPGHVWLAHVAPRLDIPGESFEGAAIIYAQGVHSAFRKIEERLEQVDWLEVQPAVLEGKAADELLAFAAEQGADMLVSGAHGHSLIERLLIGSVTTRLLRAAQCAVLVIPPYQEAKGASGRGPSDPRALTERR